MTLAIALKWVEEGGESIVIASDSKVTSGLVSYEVRKIFPISLKETPIAIAAGAGDAVIVKQAYRIFEIKLLELAKSWKSTPSFEQFEEAVGILETALMNRFRELRGQGLDFSFEMILASLDSKGQASIYLFDERGLAEPVHENPGFAVIGKGFITGGNLLLRLFGYDPKWSKWFDLGVLTTFIIEIVSEVDPSVGSFVGESWRMWVENGEVQFGPLKEEAIKEFKDRVKKRKELLRKLWTFCDLIGEEEVNKKLSELEREFEKIYKEFTQNLHAKKEDRKL